MDAANCHPYSGFDSAHKRWTLIHNGTIFDYAPLSHYIKKQKGETDSERIFLYLLDEINKLNASDFDDNFELFDSVIPDMSKGNKLNLLFADGEYLYAHTNCRDTLFYLENDGTAIISTVPLDGERWKPIPFCTLVAFKKGKIVKTGTAHNNEYTNNDENVMLLYRMQGCAG